MPCYFFFFWDPVSPCNCPSCPGTSSVCRQKTNKQKNSLDFKVVGKSQKVNWSHFWVFHVGWPKGEGKSKLEVLPWRDPTTLEYLRMGIAAGDMLRWLRALATFPEDLSFSTHTAAYNWLYHQVLETQHHFLACAHTCRLNIGTYRINK